MRTSEKGAKKAYLTPPLLGPFKYGFFVFDFVFVVFATGL
jgi:hypothetical protein